MNARPSTWVGLLVLPAVVIALAVVALPAASAATIVSPVNGLALTAAGTMLPGVMPQAADEEPPENQPPPSPPQPPDKKGPGRHREGLPPPSGEGRSQDAGEGPPEGPAPDGPPMPSPEMVGRAMEILRARLPVFHRRMMRLREQHPERFERMMRQVLPVVLEYIELRDRNPEVAETIIREFEIEDQLRALSGKFRKAAEKLDEQAAIGKEIERLVQEQFELRFRRQAARLDEFERRIREQQQRLEEQRAKLKEDNERRADLVAKRVADVKEGKIGEPFLGRGPRPNGPPGAMRRRLPGGPGDGERSPRLGPGREGPPRAGRDREGPPGPGQERPPGAGPGDGNQRPPADRPPPPNDPNQPHPPGDDPDDPDEESEDE